MESSNGHPDGRNGIRRLVIVADNSLIVETIRLCFLKTGEFRLVGYADARRTSAPTIVGAEPDVLLIDDMERAELALQLMREVTEQSPRVSMIVLSATTDPTWLEQLFQAGAVGVISKAAHPSALVTLIRELLDGHVFPRSSRPGTVPSGSSSATSDEWSLTEREREILRLVASGSTNGDVARRLWVTEQTVKFHLRNIYRKLDVANRTQASHFAYANGLVSLSAMTSAPSAPALTAVS